MFRLYVRAIIFNSRDEVLLIQKRTDQKIAPGQWILPGGTIEFSEDPLTALDRELKEEIDFEMESNTLVGCETIIIKDTHWLGLYYRVTGNTDRIINREPEKHIQIKWATKEFAHTNLSDQSRVLLSGEKP